MADQKVLHVQNVFACRKIGPRIKSKHELLTKHTLIFCNYFWISWHVWKFYLSQVFLQTIIRIYLVCTNIFGQVVSVECENYSNIFVQFPIWIFIRTFLVSTFLCKHFLKFVRAIFLLQIYFDFRLCLNFTNVTLCSKSLEPKVFVSLKLSFLLLELHLNIYANSCQS